MSTYTQVFGGTNIYPSDVSYLEFPLTTSDIFLTWPVETNAPTAGALPSARIMDVYCTGTSRKVYTPPADESAPGQCLLFNNTGTQSFTVVDATGGVICSIIPGSLWQVYMTSNATEAGVWVAYQFGAATSAANAAALAGKGLKAITTTLNQAISVLTLNSNYTLGATERAQLINWTGSTGTIGLTTAPTLGADWFCYIRNSGSSDITIDPNGAELINGVSDIAISPGNSCMVICDGVAFFTVGLSSSGSSAGFNYISIDVSGTGDYTLSVLQQNKISYDLTGILTGNRNIIVPTTKQQYWVTNATTGSFSLTVKTATGTGIVVAQGQALILYCDGTNVVQGQTNSTVATPIAISDGGTGATTAGGALINLGGTSTGIGLFTAASVSAAQTALGAGLTGLNLFESTTQAAAWTVLGVAPAGVVDGGTF